MESRTELGVFLDSLLLADLVTLGRGRGQVVISIVAHDERTLNEQLAGRRGGWEIPAM